MVAADLTRRSFGALFLAYAPHFAALWLRGSARIPGEHPRTDMRVDVRTDTRWGMYWKAVVEATSMCVTY